MPAAEVLRFPPPSVHVAALQKVRAAFYGLGAKEGFEVVRALPGIAPSTRAAAQWARDKGVSDESGLAIQSFAFATGSLQEKVRGAATQCRNLAREMQRWYVGLVPRNGGPVSARRIGCSRRKPVRGHSNCRAPVSSRAPGLTAKTVRNVKTRPYSGCGARRRRTLALYAGIAQSAPRRDV